VISIGHLTGGGRRPRGSLAPDDLSGAELNRHHDGMPAQGHRLELGTSDSHRSPTRGRTGCHAERNDRRGRIGGCWRQYADHSESGNADHCGESHLENCTVLGKARTRLLDGPNPPREVCSDTPAWVQICGLGSEPRLWTGRQPKTRAPNPRVITASGGVPIMRNQQEPAAPRPPRPPSPTWPACLLRRRTAGSSCHRRGGRCRYRRIRDASSASGR
jgi:hypothetical protein